MDEKKKAENQIITFALIKKFCKYYNCLEVMEKSELLINILNWGRFSNDEKFKELLQNDLNKERVTMSNIKYYLLDNYEMEDCKILINIFDKLI